MIRIVNESEQQKRIIPMEDMKPLQVGRINDKDCTRYNGFIVMRTASFDKFEVMDLSNPGANDCWSGSSTLLVELLPPGEKITLELYNE